VDGITRAKEVSRLVFNQLTIEIIYLATQEGLYPNEIARKLKKSSSLVVKRLKELEKHGIVRGFYTTKNDKAVKKYELADEELVFRINLWNGKTWILEKKNSAISRILKDYPDMFEGFENYLLWSKGKFSSDEVANITGLSFQESDEFLKEIKGSVENMFLTAYISKIQGWKDGLKNAYLDFIDDYVIIPTNRLNKLSTLKEETDIQELEVNLRHLEKMKMVILEKKHFPRITLDKVVELAKTMDGCQTEDVGKTLYILGGETGRSLKRFLKDPESFKSALEILFGTVKVIGADDRIVLENCRVCNGFEENPACNFVSGLIKSVLEGYGFRMEVKKEKKEKNELSCSFGLTPVGDGTKNPLKPKAKLY
jgi:predicted hydrocarbon binding protein